MFAAFQAHQHGQQMGKIVHDEAGFTKFYGDLMAFYEESLGSEEANRLILNHLVGKMDEMAQLFGFPPRISRQN